MVNKLIWIVLLLLVGGYFLNAHFESKAKEKAVQAERERQEKAEISAIEALVDKNNAIGNWAHDLGKEKHYKLLSYELERLWITDRPILFIGLLEDISSIDRDNYRIDIHEENSIIKANYYSSNIAANYYLLSSDLQLSLQCPKKQIDSFLKDHPDLFKFSGKSNRVAVIAAIKEIKAENKKIGLGQCIDMLSLTPFIGQ